MKKQRNVEKDKVPSYFKNYTSMLDTRCSINFDSKAQCSNPHRKKQQIYLFNNITKVLAIKNLLEQYCAVIKPSSYNSKPSLFSIINMFPNSAKNELNVCTSLSDAQLTIADVTGRLRLKTLLKQGYNKIAVSRLRTGF